MFLNGLRQAFAARSGMQGRCPSLFLGLLKDLFIKEVLTPDWG
jgi:hypothetical protein